MDFELEAKTQIFDHFWGGDVYLIFSYQKMFTP